MAFILQLFVVAWIWYYQHTWEKIPLGPLFGSILIGYLWAQMIYEILLAMPV